METKYHVGIDLHKTVAQICVRDAEGAIDFEKRVRMPDQAAGEELVALLLRFRDGGRYAVEALGCNRWLVNALLAEELDVVVADATKLDLRKQGKKTDRRDAREIARRLYLGDLDRFAKTYFASDAEYGLRKLLRLKHGLAERRTRTCAEIRGLLNAYLLRPPGSQLWLKKAVAWLRQQELPSADLTFALRVLVDDLEAVQARIVAVMKRIEERALQEPRAKALQEDLPQAGAQTVLTIIAELGDATRFRRARDVASYGGVVPRVYESADKAHHGRMTKRGNSELRWIIGQWAVRLLAFHGPVRAWARPLLRRMHKNKVRMALARRLLVGIWVTLGRGEVFSLERCLGIAR